MLMVKNLPAKTGVIRDVGLIFESGRYPGGGHGNPLQCSCLEVHRAANSQTELKQIGMHTYEI